MQFITHWTSRGASGDLGGGKKTGFGNILTRLPAISPGVTAPWRLFPRQGRLALPLLLRLLGPHRRLLSRQPQARPPAKPLSSPLPSHHLGGWGSAISWPISCRCSPSGELGGTGEHPAGPSPASPTTLPLRREAVSSSIRCGHLQAQFKSSACVPRAPTPPAAVCDC